MLMVTELPRRAPRKAVVLSLFDGLKNPDAIAVCAFAVCGLLATIVLASVFPLDKAVELLLLFD